MVWRTFVPSGAAVAPGSVAREATITRLSVLRTAAEFLGQMAQVHEDVKSDHVLVLAERWLAWVEQNGGDETD